MLRIMYMPSRSKRIRSSWRFEWKVLRGKPFPNGTRADGASGTWFVLHVVMPRGVRAPSPGRTDVLFAVFEVFTKPGPLRSTIIT